MTFKEAMKEAKGGTMVTCAELGEEAIGVCRDHEEYFRLQSEGKDGLEETGLLLHTRTYVVEFESNSKLENATWDYIRSI